MTFLYILWFMTYIAIIATFWVMKKRISLQDERLKVCSDRIEILHRKIDIAYHLTTGKDLDTYGERNET